MKQSIALILILLFLNTGNIPKTIMLLVRNKNSFLGAAIWCFVGTPSYMVEQKCPDNNHKCSKLDTECKYVKYPKKY